MQLRPEGGKRAAGRGACGSEPLMGGGPPGQLPPKRGQHQTQLTITQSEGLPGCPPQTPRNMLTCDPVRVT